VFFVPTKVVGATSSEGFVFSFSFQLANVLWSCTGVLPLRYV